VAKERVQDNFIKLYRDLIYALGLENAIVLGQLIGCEEMFGEGFFQTNAQIMFYTGLSKLKVRKALIELEMYELINVKRHTQNNKNIYSINHYNVDLIHYIDKQCSDDKTKVKGKYTRLELQQNWWYDFKKNGNDAIQIKLKDEMNFNNYVEKVDLSKLIARYKDFKLYENDELNNDLKHFFKKLKNAEKKEVFEYLYTYSPVAICLSTYISVFKIMHKELPLKIPKDYNASMYMLKNIYEMLNVSGIYNDFNGIEMYCKVYANCWKWLLSKDNEMFNAFVDWKKADETNTYEHLKIDYSIFFYVSKPVWYEGYNSTNWFKIAFNKTMPELYESIKEKYGILNN